MQYTRMNELSRLYIVYLTKMRVPIYIQLKVHKIGFH